MTADGAMTRSSGHLPIGDADKVRAAYARCAFWQERVAMAQWWSDHLDQLLKGGQTVKFPESYAW